MNILQKHLVPGEINATRLSDYAVEVFKNLVPSRKGMKKAILKGAILVNGQQGDTGTWIKGGELLEFVELSIPQTRKLTIDLPVVYEDDFIAVINKPGGLLTSGNQFRTVQQALSYNLKVSNQKDRLRLARPVHRLDAATCGLLLIAKTASAQIHLHQQFESRQINKLYQAIVMGKIALKGELNMPIQGKVAITQFEKIRENKSIINDWLSWVKLIPQTGRTHQLRIHMSELGHPILGDALYGIAGKIKKGKGLFLCASDLQFIHPKQEKSIKLSIVPPPKFALTLNREQKMWEKLNSSNENLN